MYARNGEPQFASYLVKSDSKYATENEEDDVFQVDLPLALLVEEMLLANQRDLEDQWQSAHYFRDAAPTTGRRSLPGQLALALCSEFGKPSWN